MNISINPNQEDKELGIHVISTFQLTEWDSGIANLSGKNMLYQYSTFDGD